MGKWYGIKNLSINSIKNFRKELLGSNSNKSFSLYVPEYLDHMVEAINLPSSVYFSSYKSIIDKLSIFPFHSLFVKKEVKEAQYQTLRSGNMVSSIESAFNIRKYGDYYEGGLNIKFCKYCVQEKGEFYLKKEHQIQNNYVCYKHKVSLHYVSFDNLKRYNLHELDTINAFNCISEKDKHFKIRVDVANAINILFNYLELGELNIIKSKIRKKLKELNYMYKDRIQFLNINKFWYDFSEFNLISIDSKELLRIIFNTEKETSPIAYITIILFLFGSIDNFIKYNVIPSEITNIYCDTESTQLLVKPNKLFENYYNNELKCIYNNEFEVIEIKKQIKHLIIKHNKCGLTWEIHKSGFRNLKNCPYCNMINRRLNN